MNPIQFINDHTFALAIMIVIGVLIYIFYPRTKNNSQIQEAPTGEIKEQQPKKENFLDRLANSNYVKGLEEEKKNAKFDDMMPKELFTGNNNDDDPWSMDFSKTGKTDL